MSLLAAPLETVTAAWAHRTANQSPKPGVEVVFPGTHTEAEPNSRSTVGEFPSKCLKGLGNKEKLLGRVGGMHYIKTGRAP